MGDADKDVAFFAVPANLAEAANYVFTLRVTDSGDLSDEDSVRVHAARGSRLLSERAGQPRWLHGIHRGSSLQRECRPHPAAFTNGLLTIAGGELSGHTRLVDGSNIAWQLEVTPDGDADVVVTLPAGRPCDANRVPCTPGGGILASAASVTVDGNKPPEITGTTTFTVEENSTAVATLTATDTHTQATDLTWLIPADAAGGADGGKFTLSTGRRAGVLLGEGLRERRRRRRGRRLRGHCPGERWRPDGHGGPDGDADERQRGAHRRCGPGPLRCPTLERVTLSGSGSDPENDTLSYAWTQTGTGQRLTLTGEDTATAVVTMPNRLPPAATFTFTLRVTDTGDLYHEDMAAVTARPAPLTLNVDPIAGDNTINIAEKAAGFSISGDTGEEAGVAVTVTVGTTELTATSVDLDATDADDTATWLVTVPAAASYIAGTGVVVTVSASKAGLTAPAGVERRLAIDLTAPTAPSYTAPASLKVGVAVANISPAGAVGVGAYSATGLPSGLVIDETTGVISGTPDKGNASTATATVTASDAAGNADTASIAFPLEAKGDQTLSGFSYSSGSVRLGAAAPTVTAPSGAQTALSYSAAPSAVCTVDAATGALTLVGPGACAVTATAAGTDDYNEATATFTVTVQAAAALTLNVDAIAGDNTINIAEKAAGFSISGDTGEEDGVAVSRCHRGHDGT